jgi:hypothetical protein
MLKLEIRILISLNFFLLANTTLNQTHINDTNSRVETNTITINYDKNRITDEQRLLSYLLTNYDSSTRPVYNSSNRIVINFGLMLIQICDMVCIQQGFNPFLSTLNSHE